MMSLMHGNGAEDASKNKDEIKARNYVWRLIKERLRSEQEIRQRLNFKKYKPPVIEKTVSYFKDLDYINDVEFAQAWVNSRLRKPLGLKAIAVELKQKGISKEIIDELIEKKRRSVDERAVARELAQKYLNKSRGRKELPEKMRLKLYAYLLRRGFSSDVVTGVLQQLNKKCNDF